ncbi:acyl-CoA-binding protein [Pseudorhodoferax soli]|jgi:diazepam-binding inhibitor (GABA receptor modulator, acyl-CoA-binding protein)|uniref:Acyl-CoA-binding protein n=1 Tax=Pseudorhodoferax soli TaxID=545864 RepID=A0A368XH60_9BURK|nr:acyl-CoA-binding protein [Pseudorhodoferax soli]RCW67341.1 acyl-CoA-binding protein [Pseudorhodoferax soli]
MSELQTAFQAAVVASQQRSQRPDNATLLRLYGLYKQASTGDNKVPKPGFSDMVGRAKWDAWNKLQGMSAEDAMQQYIDAIATLDE